MVSRGMTPGLGFGVLSALTMDTMSIKKLGRTGVVVLAQFHDPKRRVEQKEQGDRVSVRERDRAREEQRE